MMGSTSRRVGMPFDKPPSIWSARGRSRQRDRLCSARWSQVPVLQHSRHFICCRVAVDTANVGPGATMPATLLHAHAVRACLFSRSAHWGAQRPKPAHKCKQGNGQPRRRFPQAAALELELFAQSWGPERHRVI